MTSQSIMILTLFQLARAVCGVGGIRVGINISGVRRRNRGKSKWEGNLWFTKEQRGHCTHLIQKNQQGKYDEDKTG